MRKPNESLDDFVVKAVPPEPPAEPPSWVSLRLTGEVEVLKPLARWEAPAKPNPAILDLRPAPHRLSWFHRSLAVGGGLAIIAFIFVSAILVAIYDSPAELPESAASQFDNAGDPGELAIDVKPGGRLLPAKEPPMSDKFTTATTQLPFELPTAVRTIARSSFARLRARLTIPRPRRQPARPQIVVSEFVPTTQVIYIENGEIKSRIEPQLTAGTNNR